MTILVFLLPIILFLFFLIIKLLLSDTYALWIEEDSFVENGQAICYFISSILSLLVAIKFIKNKLTLHGVLYCVLALGLFFISMEEISWGQRIFNITTPDLFSQHNRQYEMNIHNLDTIGKSLLNKIYILIGAYGAFAWLFVLSFMRGVKTKREHIVNFVVPDWYISPYFFSVFFVYIFLEFMTPYPGSFLLWKDQEVPELLLALGFLSFAADNYIKLQIGLTTAESRIKSKDIWDKYRAYIIGIPVIIIVASILFTIALTPESGKQATETGFPKVVASAAGETGRADDLFNKAFSMCSSRKCTDPLMAIKYLNEAIKLNPDFAAAYGMRGNIYKKLGQYQLAINDYTEVIRLSPDDVRAYFNRGSAYLMRGNKTPGCSDAQKACELGNCALSEEFKRKGICH